MKLFSSLIVIVFLSFATALHADEAATSEPLIVTKLPEKSGPVTDGCQFSLSSSKVTYRYDQSVPLRFEIKNVNVESVGMSRDHLFDMYRFDVRLPDGEPAPLTLYGKLLNQRPFFGSSVFINLDRGMTDTHELSAINRIYDMTLEGEYMITVYRKNFSVNGTVMKTEVASNELKVVVSLDLEQQDEHADEQKNDQEFVAE